MVFPLALKIYIPNSSSRGDPIPTTGVLPQLEFLEAAPPGAEAFSVLMISDVQVVQPARTKVQRRQSSYVATTLQKVNPVYTQLQNEFHTTQANLNQARLANNTFIVSYLSGRLLKLQRELGETDPYIEEPVIRPYEYVTYQIRQGFAGTISAHLLDESGTEIGTASLPIEVLSVGDGIEGVMPTDTDGLKAKTPSSWSQEKLESELGKELLAKGGQGCTVLSVILGKVS